MVLKATAFVRVQLIAVGYEANDLMKITPVISCAVAQGFHALRRVLVVIIKSGLKEVATLNLSWEKLVNMRPKVGIPFSLKEL